MVDNLDDEDFFVFVVDGSPSQAVFVLLMKDGL
jgi:hypothetical protein